MKRFRNPVSRSGAIGVWAALVLFAGCRYVDKLLDEPEPAVDPRQVFPAFDASRSTSSSSVGLWDFPPCAGGGAADSGRLRLGDLFTADLPQGEGWARVEGGRATILVRYAPGSSIPSAFLYSERIDAGGLGTALLRFHGRVDQRLKALRRPTTTAAPPPPATTPESENGGSAPPGDPGAGEPEDPAAGEPAALPPGEGPTDGPPSAGEPTSMDSTTFGGVSSGEGIASDAGAVPGALTQAAETAAALATLAVGYASEEGSFTGWRWIGVCAPPEEEAGEGAGSTATEPDTAIKPFLRLSRSRGSWRLQPGAQPVPALLILATVTLPDRRNYGAHLAIVCTETPQCQDAPALARLLGSIRVAPGAGGPAGDDWASDTLRELAEEVGISMPASHTLQ